MKIIALMVSLFVCFLNPARAGSIPKEEISADLKWFVHVDAAKFRATKVGDYIITQILESKLSAPIAQMNAKFKLDIKVEKILDGIKSFTVYGSDYDSPQENSVLLIDANPDVEKIFVGVLAGMSLAGSNAPVQVTLTQEGGVSFYAAPDMAYCAILPGKVIAIGHSREIVEHAAKVLNGKAPSLASGGAIAEFADTTDAFFFLGVAQGFNLGNNLPPQAKLLQAADAGRVALGEDAGQIFLHLALRGKTTEVVTQMEQVVQGLVAIGTLSQPQDKDVAHLLNSIKVSANNLVVNVGVDYPVDRALDKLGQVRDKMLKKQAIRNGGSSSSEQNASAPVEPESASKN